MFENFSQTLRMFGHSISQLSGPIKLIITVLSHEMETKYLLTPLQASNKTNIINTLKRDTLKKIYLSTYLPIIMLSTTLEECEM